MDADRTIQWKIRDWKPGLCSDCHRPPGEQRLRRGLCMACYQYRRRRGLAMPPKVTGAVLHRKRDRKGRGLARSPWDRFR